MASFSPAFTAIEDLLHRMTDRIRRSLELPEILEATVTEMRQFLLVDRVKIYQFQENDSSGEVVAESIDSDKLPALLGQRFPADDIPPEARKMFRTLQQRSIVNVAAGEIGVSAFTAQAAHQATQTAAGEKISFRTVDPCHLIYLEGMGVQASLAVPLLSQHRLWGLLVAHHSTPKQFGERELEIVQLIADQVEVAISQANLLEMTRQQGRHEAIINQTVSRLHSTVKDPLNNTLAYLTRALGCDGSRLFVQTSDTAQQRIVTQGLQPQSADALVCTPLGHQRRQNEEEQDVLGQNAEICFEQLPAWQTWLKNEVAAQTIADIWAISDVQVTALPEPLSAAFLQDGIYSLLSAKLVHRNRFIGYLSLFRRSRSIETIWAGKLDEGDARQTNPRKSFEAWRELRQNQSHPWLSKEVNLVQALSEQIASVIYQTQLYQEVQALNNDLEQRVMRRTADLQRLNESLVREIAEREQAFVALQAARDSLKRLGEQNELILRSAGEGIYGIDREGKIVFVNPAAARLLGCEARSLIGALMHDWVNHSTSAGEPYAWAQNPIHGTLDKGQTHHVSGDLFDRKDGFSFPVEYVSTPMQEKGRIIGAVIVFKDITERQMIESMRDEFVAVVSHELRTPLTSIRAALGLLAQEQLPISTQKRQRMMQIAFSNTNRLVRLVNDILDVEQIKLGKITLNKQECDLFDLTAQAIDEMNAMANNYGVQLCSNARSVSLEADPDRIIQTLTNLLSNAIKFSESGSVVEVSAQTVSASTLSSVSPTLSISGQNALKTTVDYGQGAVLVAVKDRGKGIPEDKREVIFNQFEQLGTADSDHRGGTGLGLAICRSIVQQHKGYIWVESNVGKGSTFFFTLPASP